MQITNFPDSIGNKWIYKHTNASNTDTIEIEVVKRQIFLNNTYSNVWVYRYKPYGEVDTMYEVRTTDSLSFYYSPTYLVSKYKLPISVGDIDTLPMNALDVTTITGPANITVPASSFGDCLQADHLQSYIFNSSAVDTMWYKDGVGMVKKIQHDYSLGPLRSNGLWELQSYQVH